ncbi:MAG TPA: GAF domain-containing protein, partial [Terrimesophilobacter sp.]|nr:GAF domain-containing protein [Terrimesophilobacter sp.]
MNAISSAISSTLSLNEVVEMIVQESVRALNVEQGAVMLLRHEDVNADPFRTIVRKNDTGSAIVPFRFGQQLTGWMLKHQKPLLINDLPNDERFGMLSSEDLKMQSLLSVPLRAKGQMVGLLNVFNKRSPDGFGRDDQRLLTIIASQSAQIVESARLYEELQRRSNELLDSERKYRALISEAGVAILLADFGTRRVIEANEKAADITGFGSTRLRGVTLDRVLPVKELELDETFAQLEAEGNLRYGAVPVTRAGGEAAYIDVGATLISIGGTRIVQVICHDVTERQR